MKTKELIIKYSVLSETLNEIQSRIGEIEETIDALDATIEQSESRGLSPNLIDELSKARNDLDLVRLNLSLKANEIEHALLNFERVRLLTI